MNHINASARLLAVTVFLTLSTAAQAAVILTGPTYSENFDGLISSGTAAVDNGVLANGWQFRETGSNGNSSYRAGTGSDNSGDTYSFGNAGSSERAFGTLASGTLLSTIGVVFENRTGATIDSLDLDFFGEQWRRGSSTSGRLMFEYLVGADDLAGGGWVRFDGFDITDVATGASGAVNGNLVANRQRITGTLSGLGLGASQRVGFRWVDMDESGSDHALAIDDFTMSLGAAAVPEPASWAMMIGGFGLVGAAMRRRTQAAVTA